MNLDDQLRRHDPARDVPEDLGRSPRALATLDRVTATEPATMSVGAPHRRRAVSSALAAMVAAAGVVVAPILGTDDDAAVATWDAEPRPATAQETTNEARYCSKMVNVPLDVFRPRVVEVRGSWVMTYLASATDEVQCLRSTEPSAEFPEGANEAMSGPLAETPAADALATTGVTQTSGGITDGSQFMVAGKVGSEVTGVVFDTQDLQVHATIKGDRFTAWWPQRKPASVYGRVMDNNGWNGSPNPIVKITLRSGKVITTHIKDYDVNH
jgi:hypothetical protein